MGKSSFSGQLSKQWRSSSCSKKWWYLEPWEIWENPLSAANSANSEGRVHVLKKWWYLEPWENMGKSSFSGQLSKQWRSSSCSKKWWYLEPWENMGKSSFSGQLSKQWRSSSCSKKWWYLEPWENMGKSSLETADQDFRNVTLVILVTPWLSLSHNTSFFLSRRLTFVQDTPAIASAVPHRRQDLLSTSSLNLRQHPTMYQTDEEATRDFAKINFN